MHIGLMGFFSLGEEKHLYLMARRCDALGGLVAYTQGNNCARVLNALALVNRRDYGYYIEEIP